MIFFLTKCWEKHLNLKFLKNDFFLTEKLGKTFLKLKFLNNDFS